MTSKYSVLERLIAKFLSRFPVVKLYIKRKYQEINAIVYKKKYSFKSKYYLNSFPCKGESFFGYYDKSPLSNNEKHLLYHSTEYSTKLLPNPKSPVTVGIFDLEKKETVWSGSSTAYNWQQGTKAQWISESEFIYNNYDETEAKYISKRINLTNGNEDTYPFPIYDCYRDEYGLTVNFNRLLTLRPDYGYRNIGSLDNREIKELDKDGVFYCDLKDKKYFLIISLSKLCAINYKEEMNDAFHKVNHIMISPDGEKFIFLHRYFINKRRIDRLFLSNKEGTELKVLKDDEMVSHCFWLNNEMVIGYWRGKEGDKYYKIKIDTEKEDVIGLNIISHFGDGHPCVNKNKMVFDTYPDKSRMKQLFLFDIQDNNLENIGEFYESLDYYGETRCDLHPRFNNDGTKVFFDSVHDGKRGLYWIEL